MTTKSLIQLLVSAAIAVGLASCSALVDPSTGDTSGDDRYAAAQENDGGEVSAASAADSTELREDMDRLRRQNVAMRARQSESQARMETMEIELAEERETQAQFREMMAANFDLLEQSVSRSLAQNGEGDQSRQGPNAQAGEQAQAKAQGVAPLPMRTIPPPTPAPAGAEPMTHWDDNGDPGAATAVAPAAAMAPGVAAGMADERGQGGMNDSQTLTDPAQGMSQDQPTNQAQAPAMMPPGTDPQRGTAQMGAAGNGPASSRNGQNGQAMTPPPPAAGGSTAASAQRPSALETLQPEQPSWAASAAVPVAMGRSDRGNEPLDDPDLQPPAQPVELAAHAAAKPLYDKGFVHFARGNYDDSIRTYSEFLERFPSDTHSDNAQFWIGEAYFQMGRYDEAESAYRAVLRNYEHRSTIEGYKSPDSIFRLGQIHLGRDDTRRAAYYFRNVTERFPQSTAGRKSQHELDSLQLDTAADRLSGVGGTDS